MELNQFRPPKQQQWPLPPLLYLSFFYVPDILQGGLQAGESVQIPAGAEAGPLPQLLRHFHHIGTRCGGNSTYLISPDCSCNAFNIFCWCPPVLVVTVCSMAKPTRQCQRFPQLCRHSVIVVNKNADTVSTYLCRYRIWRGCVPEEMLGPLSSIFRV